MMQGFTHQVICIHFIQQILTQQATDKIDVDFSKYESAIY